MSLRIHRVADWLYGCTHRKTTFPMTLQSDTYIVCLECGRHFAYDWTTMRIAKQRG
jgi:DNA-directed RNA polymerase subunit RPC12/RpoP